MVAEEQIDPETPEEKTRKTELDLTQMPLQKSVMTLAIPAVLRMSLQTIVGVAALAIIGRLGTEAAAAVGLGNRLVFFFIGVLMALSIGTTALVARFTGAKDPGRAEEAVRQSVILAFFIGIGVALLGYLYAEDAIRIMIFLQDDLDQTVIAWGGIYLRWLSVSMVLGVFLFIANAALQGAGDMKTPLYLMVVVNVINVFLAYVLIYGYGPFPQLGITGAAIAGGVSRAIGGAAGLLVLFSGRFAAYMPWYGPYRFHVPMIRALIFVGVPAAIENLVRQSAQMIYTILIGGLGTVAIAANTFAMSAQSFSFMPGFGFSVAATSLVGQNLGAKQPDKAEQAGWESLKWSVYFMSVMGLIFFFFPRQVLAIYTNDPTVMELAVPCLRVIAISQPFLASIMVLAGGLRGAGDTRWVMYITAAGNWGIRLVFSYLLGFSLGWGLTGVWIAMGLDMILRGILTLWRFRSGKWKDIELPTDDQDDPAQGLLGSDSGRDEVAAEAN